MAASAMALWRGVSRGRVQLYLWTSPPPPQRALRRRRERRMRFPAGLLRKLIGHIPHPVPPPPLQPSRSHPSDQTPPPPRTFAPARQGRQRTCTTPPTTTVTERFRAAYWPGTWWEGQGDQRSGGGGAPRCGGERCAVVPRRPNAWGQWTRIFRAASRKFPHWIRSLQHGSY